MHMKLKGVQLLLFFICIIATVSCGSDDDTNVGNNHENGTKEIPISRLTLTKNSAIIAIGDTIHLSCVITPANATTKEILWSSQKPSIAVVSDEGIVTALAEGDCEIYAKAEGYTWLETCKLHIINPDIYQAVDLGLPSGTKWGTKNLYYEFNGTDTPFAWAEISGKEIYYWGYYKWCNEVVGDYNLRKYCSQDKLNELKEEDDAAYIYGAHKWRTPSKAEFQELIDNCTWTYEDLSYTDNNRHKDITYGRYKVTGPNGNSIYFGLDGEHYSNKRERYGEIGVYWTREIADENLVNKNTPGDDPYRYACVLEINKGHYTIEAWARFYGILIRPVRIK